MGSTSPQLEFQVVPHFSKSIGRMGKVIEKGALSKTNKPQKQKQKQKKPSFLKMETKALFWVPGTRFSRKVNTYLMPIILSTETELCKVIHGF